jgi:hypothetical protein
MTVAKALALCVISLAALPIGASPICGDCDADGNVAIIDALRVARLGVGLLPLRPCEDFANCDVNGDGNLQVTDALAIARLSAGLPQTLHCSLPTASFLRQGTITPAGSRSYAIAPLWRTVPGGQEFVSPICVASPGAPCDPAIQLAVYANPAGSGVLAFQQLLGFTDHVDTMNANGDLNGDGIRDFVCRSEIPPRERVEYLGTPSGGFVELQRTTADPRWTPVGSALVDLDGDGLADMIGEAEDPSGGAGAAKVTTWKMQPGTGLVPWQDLQPITRRTQKAVGDINGDALPDLVIGGEFGIERQPDVRIFLNDGLGTLVHCQDLPVPHPTLVYSVEPQLADFTGDGILDLLVLSFGPEVYEPGYLQVLAGDGGGGFAPITILALGAVMKPAGGMLRDVDGDGHLDVAYFEAGPVPVHQRPVLAWCRATGAGGFTEMPTLQMPPPADPLCQHSLLDAHDVDGDGDADLILNWVNDDPTCSWQSLELWHNCMR